MTFTTKEKLSISLLLFLSYLIPALPEWLQYKTGHFRVIGMSAPIWLTCFYIGPYWLNYAIYKVPFINKQHVVVKGILFIVLMCFGAVLVNKLHLMVFEHYRFSFAQQITSAVLWGIFFFAMTQLYLMYLRLQQERKLREHVQWVNLNNRLNPHFLFNSLNTISALMYQSVDEADEVLHKLSDILRYSLDKQAQWVSLEHELAICRTYLAIEKARFTDNLNIEWHYEESLLKQVNVPPLLLQPLIENAIKHVTSRPIKLVIAVEKQAADLIFSVQDNGQGFPEKVFSSTRAATEKSGNTGHGLDITAQRLVLLDGELKLTNKGGALCQVVLPIKACE